IRVDPTANRGLAAQRHYRRCHVYHWPGSGPESPPGCWPAGASVTTSWTGSAPGRLKGALEIADFRFQIAIRPVSSGGQGGPGEVRWVGEAGEVRWVGEAGEVRWVGEAGEV